MLHRLRSLPSCSWAVPRFLQEKELRQDAVKSLFAILQGAVGSRGLTSILLGKPSVVDASWAPARQEALAHHLLLLGRLQALGNPLSCSGTTEPEPHPSSELQPLPAAGGMVELTWERGLSALRGSQAAPVLGFVTLGAFNGFSGLCPGDGGLGGVMAGGGLLSQSR